MNYVLQNKLGNIIEYVVLIATFVYFTGEEWGVSETDWTVVTTDVVEDATKFYSKQEAFNMLAWVENLPEGDWQPVKLEDLL